MGLNKDMEFSISQIEISMKVNGIKINLKAMENIDGLIKNLNIMGHGKIIRCVVKEKWNGETEQFLKEYG